MIELYAQGGHPNQIDRLPTGVLLTPDALPTLEAFTHHGLRVQAHGLHPHSSSWTSAGFARLVFKPHEVVLTSDVQVEFDGSMKGLVSGMIDGFANSNSSSKDDNPVFGGESHSRDWLRLETDSGGFALRENRDEFVRCATWLKGKNDLDVVMSSRAFLQAMSFWAGCRVEWLAYTQLGRKIEKTVLRQPTAQKRLFFPPVPHQAMSAYELQLVEKATRYFLLPDHQTVANFLALCWDSTGSFFPSQCLVASAVVEGLADFITSETPMADTLKAERDRFNRFKGRAKQALEVNISPEDGDLLTRVLNWLHSVPMLRQRDMILKAAELLRITISEEEVLAWKQMRDSVAHGRLQTGDEDIAELRGSSLR